MQAESLEVLERADVAPAQARAIVRAIEIEIAGARDLLATKFDLTNLRADIRADMGELKIGLRGEMEELRTELRSEMQDLRRDLCDKMQDLRVGVRGEIQQLGTQLRDEMAKLRGDFSRQLSMAIIGQTAAMLGFFYFFMTQAR